MSSGDGSVGVSPGRLADDHFHSGKSAAAHPGLEIVRRLRDRRPWHRHRHVEDAPFVQRRHVIVPIFGKW